MFIWDWCILLETDFKFAIIREVCKLYICVLMCFRKMNRRILLGVEMTRFQGSSSSAL